ncbi:MAG: malate permease [Chthoniobacter sp.]|jgi:predicted permease|nr:malate permease [Chthoniobacter sp.]
MSGSYLTLLAAVAPVFVIVMAGFAIRRVGWLTEEADASLMRVIVNLLFPCLILDTILGNPALEQVGNVLLAPAVGFGTVILGFAVAFFAAPVFGVRDARTRRTFAFTVGLYNYGYVALPLIQQLFPPQTAGVLFIHNLGVETALWTAGLWLVSGGKAGAERRGWLRILNAPVVAILTAVALHFAGARYWLPSVVLGAVHSIGAAAIPMGLILTGATFCDQVPQISWKHSLADSTGACLLRLGVLPICFLAIARWLPCPIELRHVIVVQAAMPCAVIPVLLAKHYGGEPALALRIILATSLLGLLTIPLWIQVGLWWIGG